MKAHNSDILTKEELKKLQKAYDSNKYTEVKKEVFPVQLLHLLVLCRISNVAYGDLKPVKLKKDPIEELILCSETNVPKRRIVKNTHCF